MDTQPLLVISPHLDDATFACGRLLASTAGATVATIFAGRPPPGFPLTDWDRASGFSEGDDTVGARREEDRRAMACLGANPVWLDLCDSQYRFPPWPGQIVAELRRLLETTEPGSVFFPLGLFHSDHRLVHDAALDLRDADDSARRWFAYEDALYRHLPGLREARLEEYRVAGRSPRPVRFAESADAEVRKRDAVACYVSQLRALATPGRLGIEDTRRDEVFWEVGLPAAGKA